MAVTITEIIATDISGSAAAELVGATVANAGAGVVRKQPMTSKSSMSPTKAEMIPVTVRPSRSPIQCNPVNAASTESAAI
jgi:hypothetical protein